MEEENCSHKDIRPNKELTSLHLCFECKQPLVCNEVEILNMFYEVGGFCDNEKCPRYLLLVV